MKSQFKEVLLLQLYHWSLIYLLFSKYTGNSFTNLDFEQVAVKYTKYFSFTYLQYQCLYFECKI